MKLYQWSLLINILFSLLRPWPLLAHRLYRAICSSGAWCSTFHFVSFRFSYFSQLFFFFEISFIFHFSDASHVARPCCNSPFQYILQIFKFSFRTLFHVAWSVFAKSIPSSHTSYRNSIWYLSVICFLLHCINSHPLLSEERASGIVSFQMLKLNNGWASVCRKHLTRRAVTSKRSCRQFWSPVLKPVCIRTVLESHSYRRVRFQEWEHTWLALFEYKGPMMN